DEDKGYVPPYVPPQPKLDPVARGAWTALFGGPGYLFIATTLGWDVPKWAELAAIIAFISGFVILVSKLGDGPSRRDGPDHGAVVEPPGGLGGGGARGLGCPPPGEIRRPDHSRFRAEFGEHDHRVRSVLASREPAVEGSPGLREQQVAGLRHAAADHEAS